MLDALDVEDAEQRLSRLQNTLQNLNTPSTSKSSKLPSAPNFSFLNRDAAQSRPQHVEPPKELLSRVHAFLPAIQASNALLSSQDLEKIDIEHVDDSTDHYIEMNLGLGIFDVRGSTEPISMPISAHSSVSSSTSSSSSYSSTSSASSYDNDSDSESDAEIITSFVPIRPTKPLPRRAMRQMQPRIAVLGQTDAASTPGPRNGVGG
ncbi:hypothetical protein H0H87_011379 [Tephrocybe sp. NHM501043]|nr:hypothetical protein H0H87_011379 [Tephrocybe sp. NHM501043]